MSDPAPQDQAPHAAEAPHRSPNWGMPIFFVALLLAAATHRDSWWGVLWQVLYGLIVAVAVYSTFAPGEVRRELERMPGWTRRDILLFTGVPYVLIPVIGWIAAIPLHWFPGVFIPALPWLGLILLALGVTVPGLAKRNASEGS